VNALLQQFFVAVWRRPIVTLLVGVAVALGVVNYFLWQQRHDVTAHHEEVRRKGEAMLKALTDQTRIKAELAALQEALEQIDRNLVVEGEMEVNLGYFYKMERLSRVRLSQLNQLSAQPAVEGNPFKAVPFSLRVTGSYGQIMNFLHQLETGARLLRVRTYSVIRGGDAKNKTIDLDLTVELLASQ
jgi:Tfp pilus assembly protein PilO